MSEADFGIKESPSATFRSRMDEGVSTDAIWTPRTNESELDKEWQPVAIGKSEWIPVQL